MKRIALSLVVIFLLLGMTVPGCNGGDNGNGGNGYTPVVYSLSTSVNPSGAGTLTRYSTGGIYSPLASTYNAGIQVSIHADPAQGYVFDYWTDSGNITTDPVFGLHLPSHLVTMDSNKSIVAHFIKGGSNNGVTIALDNVERTAGIPSDIRQYFQNAHGPSVGHEYVCIYLTIRSPGPKVAWMVNALGYESETSLLLAAGSRYEPAYSVVVRSYQYDYRAGDEVFLVFEVPNGVELTMLSFVFTFRDSKPRERGQIDIILP